MSERFILEFLCDSSTNTLCMMWLHDKLLWKTKSKKKFSQELRLNCRVRIQKGIVTGRMKNPFSLIMSYSMVVKKRQTTLEQMKAAWNQVLNWPEYETCMPCQECLNQDLWKIKKAIIDDGQMRLALISILLVLMSVERYKYNSKCSNKLDLGEWIDKTLISTAVAFKKSNPY